MEQIYRKARAKVNLNLEVLDKRPDGYHNLKSVFQKINLYDEIYIRKTKKQDFTIQTNLPELKQEENIINKAYYQLKEKFPKLPPVEVIIHKKIPMQAGLAGGSTDAASFLIGMNQLFNLQLTKSEIETLGKNLGADVVPCLYNMPVKAEGIGERVKKIDSNFTYYFVIIKPELSGNTKQMYQRLDETMPQTLPKEHSAQIEQALKNEDIELLASNLYNSFEQAIEEKELLENIKKELIQNGAKGSLLTGSGACVYGIFADKQVAKRAYQTLRSHYQVYLCTSYHSKRRECFD